MQGDGVNCIERVMLARGSSCGEESTTYLGGIMGFTC